MTNPNESANPVFLQNGLTYDSHVDIGLTKREYFAAMAMQGMLAKYGTDYQAQHAKESVYMADELIEALNKTK